jgi:hypothetical protein
LLIFATHTDLGLGSPPKLAMPKDLTDLVLVQKEEAAAVGAAAVGAQVRSEPMGSRSSR